MSSLPSSILSIGLGIIGVHGFLLAQEGTTPSSEEGNMAPYVEQAREAVLKAVAADTSLVLKSLDLISTVPYPDHQSYHSTAGGLATLLVSTMDRTSAAIPNVAVHVEPPIGDVKVIHTDEDGNAGLEGLAPGVYALVVQHPDLHRVRYEGIRLSPNQTRRQEIVVRFGDGEDIVSAEEEGAGAALVTFGVSTEQDGVTTFEVALVEVGLEEPQIFPSMRRRLPISGGSWEPLTQQEWTRVSNWMAGFYDVSFRFEEGAERFLPFFSHRSQEIASRMRGGMPEMADAADEMVKMLFAFTLDGALFQAIEDLERIDRWRTDSPPPTDMASMLKTIAEITEARRDRLRRYGFFGKDHLNNIQEYLLTHLGRGIIFKESNLFTNEPEAMEGTFYIVIVSGGLWMVLSEEDGEFGAVMMGGNQ